MKLMTREMFCLDWIEMYIPYNRVPRPRCFKRVDAVNDYVVMNLAKRPRSPVRKILPESFDLKAARRERDRKHGSPKTRPTLEESKNRISESIRKLSADQLDENTAISSVVLQAVCEQVTLTLMDAKIDTDIHTFVNVAVIWALSELELFNRDMLLDEQFRLPEDFLYCDYARKSILDIAGNGGMRKVLLGVYRPPFSRNIHTTMHRRLPWPHVGPSHERGHTKFYPSIRERIEEIVSETIADKPTAIYIPDVRCFHRRDVLDKSYVAYKRKSKHYSMPDDKILENFIEQLVSFT